MPGGDRTGPQGQGSRTGRGLGYCAEDDQPGYATSQQGQRFGFRSGGRGNRRNLGWRNCSKADFWPGRGRCGFDLIADAQDHDIDSLKEQLSELQNTLKEVQNRLDQFQK